MRDLGSLVFKDFGFTGAEVPKLEGPAGCQRPVIPQVFRSYRAKP